jgi:hypothetical protein
MIAVIRFFVRPCIGWVTFAENGYGRAKRAIGVGED